MHTVYSLSLSIEVQNLDRLYFVSAMCIMICNNFEIKTANWSNVNELKEIPIK